MGQSKRFKDKRCVYCGIEKSIPSGDHVFAREFFLHNKRANPIKVPACDKCNNEKSTLETYLTATLPFGGGHKDAGVNLKTMVPARLKRNIKLHRQLADGKSFRWVKENGVFVRRLVFDFDSSKLNSLFRYITKGLLWWHWKVLLTSEDFVDARTLPRVEERYFNLLRAGNPVNGNLGEGTFHYEGVQATDNLKYTAWKFSIYGGIKFNDPRYPEEEPSLIWGLTAPKEATSNHT